MGKRWEPKPPARFTATCEVCGEVWLDETASSTSLLTLLAKAHRAHAIGRHDWVPPVAKRGDAA